MCISNGLNGIGKEQGAFTCVTPRGSSVVDYSVASIDLFKLIADFNIGELSTLSDYAPWLQRLILIAIQYSIYRPWDDQQVLSLMRSWTEWHPLKTPPNHQIYWSSELINELEDFFHTDTFKQKLSNLTLQLNTDETENISHFTDLLQTTVCSCSNAKPKLNTHKAKPFPRNSWFDAECKNKMILSYWRPLH